MPSLWKSILVTLPLLTQAALASPQKCSEAHTIVGDYGTGRATPQLCVDDHPKKPDSSLLILHINNPQYLQDGEWKDPTGSGEFQIQAAGRLDETLFASKSVEIQGSSSMLLATLDKGSISQGTHSFGVDYTQQGPVGVEDVLSDYKHTVISFVIENN